jgi:hypothetical protein
MAVGGIIGAWLSGDASSIFFGAVVGGLIFTSCTSLHLWLKGFDYAASKSSPYRRQPVSRRSEFRGAILDGARQRREPPGSLSARLIQLGTARAPDRSII